MRDADFPLGWRLAHGGSDRSAGSHDDRWIFDQKLILRWSPFRSLEEICEAFDRFGGGSDDDGGSGGASSGGHGGGGGTSHGRGRGRSGSGRRRGRGGGGGAPTATAATAATAEGSPPASRYRTHLLLSRLSAQIEWRPEDADLALHDVPPHERAARWRARTSLRAYAALTYPKLAAPPPFPPGDAEDGVGGRGNDGGGGGGARAAIAITLFGRAVEPIDLTPSSPLFARCAESEPVTLAPRGGTVTIGGGGSGTAAAAKNETSHGAAAAGTKGRGTGKKKKTTTLVENPTPFSLTVGYVFGRRDMMPATYGSAKTKMSPFFEEGQDSRLQGTLVVLRGRVVQLPQILPMPRYHGILKAYRPIGGGALAVVSVPDHDGFKANKQKTAMTADADFPREFEVALGVIRAVCKALCADELVRHPDPPLASSSPAKKNKPKAAASSSPSKRAAATADKDGDEDADDNDDAGNGGAVVVPGAPMTADEACVARARCVVFFDDENAWFAGEIVSSRAARKDEDDDEATEEETEQDNDDAARRCTIS